MDGIISFLMDAVAVRNVSEFVQLFGLDLARKRGRAVAREWFEKTGRYDVPGEYLWDLAASRGWPATSGDLRAHTYVEAACNELDELAGIVPCWES
jgi:ethanolamine utilization protein EutP (predicted NTPase)